VLDLGFGRATSDAPHGDQLAKGGDQRSLSGMPARYNSANAARVGH
jgi:hypothetical protein